jgi:hypothetical protein
LCNSTNSCLTWAIGLSTCKHKCDVSKQRYVHATQETSARHLAHD